MKNLIFALSLGSLVMFVGCSYKEETAQPATPKETKVAPHVSKAPKKESAKLEIDKETGLVIAEGFEQVKANCTIACHSATLVTQNRGNQKYWKDAIVYMQKNQGLWDLTSDEPVIINYLATYYGEVKAYRRAPLKVEWK